jgi:hypothetical protein
MCSDISNELSTMASEIELRATHTPKGALYISRTFKGMTPDGRYIHLTKYGRVTYHPAYYTIDGRLLQTHC